MSRLSVEAVETRLFRLGDDLAEFVLESVPREQVREGMVLAVTSKIASLAERRVVPKNQVASKVELVKLEADAFLGVIGHGVTLTIARGIFIPSAGIDESNAQGDYYILFPEDPFATAKKLWERLRQAWGVRDLGVILTDSHTTPLRRGVTGIGLSFWGFEPTEKLIGKPDLFGRPFQMTYVNRVDGLSAAAVLAMGEGTAPKPLALIDGAEVEFTVEDRRADLVMPSESDLYHPIYKHLLERASSTSVGR